MALMNDYHVVKVFFAVELNNNFHLPGEPPEWGPFDMPKNAKPTAKRLLEETIDAGLGSHSCKKIHIHNPSETFGDIGFILEE